MFYNKQIIKHETRVLIKIVPAFSSREKKKKKKKKKIKKTKKKKKKKEKLKKQNQNQNRKKKLLVTDLYFFEKQSKKE